MVDNEDGMPNSVSFEEIEAALSSPPAPQPLDKIELGSDIGSAADLIAERERLKEALRVSEEARRMQKLESRVEEVASRPSSTPTPPPAPVEMTREDLQRLYDEEPLRAIEVMQAQAEARVARNFGARLDTLTSGTISAAEQSARQRYSEEFEVLGAEIQQQLTRIPDKSVLANGNTWDEFIAYVRGKHFDKLMEHRQAKLRPSQEQVREEQVRSSGFSPAPMARPTGGSNGSFKPLDDTEKEIAKVLNISHADYRKYQ